MFQQEKKTQKVTKKQVITEHLPRISHCSEDSECVSEQKITRSFPSGDCILIRENRQ